MRGTDTEVSQTRNHHGHQSRNFQKIQTTRNDQLQVGRQQNNKHEIINVAWYNKERALAYDHSPYDTTILMDCDYFVFSSTLLELANTKFDVMLHDRVEDITGKDMILGKNESTLPLVWATVTLFQKTANARRVFDMIQHVQQYYTHYQNLYRIRYPNYRNDYAFAIALHQLKLGNFIPTPMAMLADRVDIIDSDDDGIVFKYDDCVNFTSGQDVHIMEKEWCNG